MKKWSVYFSRVIAAAVLTGFCQMTLAADTTYARLKKEFDAPKNVVPVYEDFNRVGEVDERVCLEVEKEAPDETRFFGLYLFVRHFAERGPLLPGETIKKVIGHSQPSMDAMFDLVENEITERYLLSRYHLNEYEAWEVKIKKRDELLLFTRKGVTSGQKILTYGYCYYL